MVVFRALNYKGFIKPALLEVSGLVLEAGPAWPETGPGPNPNKYQPLKGGWWQRPLGSSRGRQRGSSRQLCGEHERFLRQPNPTRPEQLPESIEAPIHVTERQG